MKYKTTLTVLDTKNEEGKFTNTKDIKLLDVLTLDDDIKLSFGYEGLKRKPYAHTCTYKNVTVIISTSAGFTFDDMIKNFGGINETVQAIKNQYTKLQLIN